MKAFFVGFSHLIRAFKKFQSHIKIKYISELVILKAFGYKTTIFKFLKTHAVRGFVLEV